MSDEKLSCVLFEMTSTWLVLWVFVFVFVFVGKKVFAVCGVDFLVIDVFVDFIGQLVPTAPINMVCETTMVGLKT